MKKILFTTLVVLTLCLLCVFMAPAASAESESTGNGAAARLAPYPGQIVEIDGTLYFQMDGVNTYMGLFQYYDGNYYYAKKSGALAVNATVNCTKTSCDLPTGNYRFDENGRLANGVFESNGKPRYYENGKSCAKGFFKLGGDYYFAKEGGYLVADAIYKPATTACDLPAGVNYRFDESGAVCQGFHDLADGTTRYYVNGKTFKAGLMLHTDGYYYYVKHSGILCKNMSLYATYSTCDLPINTNYRIGEDGRLVSGILQSNGKLRYYENGKGKNAGLVKVGVDYYYAAGSGWLRTNEKLYAQITSCDLPANTNYYFDADGKAYQGINRNSNGELTYFVNGKGANVGLFLYTDGCYYFAAGSGKLIVNNEKYYAYKTSCDLPVGVYNFDANGALIGYGAWYTPGLKFTAVSGGYSVSGYTGSAAKVVIPATYKGLPVISIGDDAFKRCKGLTSMTFAEGSQLTSIGSFAFWGCTGLTSIEIPSSVTSIGSSAFRNCTGLTSITVASGNTKYHSAGNCVIETASKKLILGCKNSIIPSDGSVTSIGDYAFHYCSGLTSITIPSSVKSIDYGAFYGCTGLTSITIPSSVTYIGNKAFYYCTGLKTVTFASGSKLTSIGDYAFEECSGLTSISIPSSVTSIGDSAFVNCLDLRKVTFDKGSQLTSIGDYAFVFCDSLTSITIPSSVTYIGNEAFYYCTGLTSITIPSSVTSIGDSAFENCTGLKTVTFAEGSKLTSIGDLAFYYCTGLTSITIPSSVTSIGSYAFYCTNLIKRDGGVSYVDKWVVGCDTSVTSVTLRANTVGIGAGAFYGCTGLTSIEIPSSVTSIGDSAFSDCTGLTSITIPSSVTSIGTYAFFGCTGLTSIEIPNGVTSIGSHAFYKCTGLTSIEIPASVTFIGSSAFSDCTGLTSVTFENPNGWWRSSSPTATSGTSISTSDLADAGTAAKYLKSTYRAYYWKRG